MSLVSRSVTFGLMLQVVALGACGSDDEAPNKDNAGGSGGDAGSTGTGGDAGSGGTGGGGSPPTTGYSSLLGVPPTTRLDELTPEQFLIACQAYNLYYNEQIAQADQVRAVCVADAVLARGAATVAECAETSAVCIDAVGGLPPPPCVPPEGQIEDCPATVQEYETCGTALVEQDKTRVALLVCESIEDPDINDKLATASGVPESCTSFAENCPALFPAPLPPPDGGVADGG